MASISLPTVLLGAGALSAGSSLLTSNNSANAARSAADAQTNAANLAAQTQLSIFNQTQQNLSPYNMVGQSALSQLARLFGLSPGAGGQMVPGRINYSGPPPPSQPGGNGGYYGGQNGDPSASPPITAVSGGQGSFLTPQPAGAGQGNVPPGYLGGDHVVPGNSNSTLGPQTADFATSALTQFPGYQFGLNQGITALDRSAASRGLLLSGAQLKDAQTFGQQYGLQQGWQPYINQLSGLSSLGENAAATAGNQGVQTGANVGASQLAAGTSTASGIVGSANALNGGIQAGLNTGLNSGLLAFALRGAGGGGGFGDNPS